MRLELRKMAQRDALDKTAHAACRRHYHVVFHYDWPGESAFNGLTIAYAKSEGGKCRGRAPVEEL